MQVKKLMFVKRETKDLQRNTTWIIILMHKYIDLVFVTKHFQSKLIWINCEVVTYRSTKNLLGVTFWRNVFLKYCESKSFFNYFLIFTSYLFHNFYCSYLLLFCKMECIHANKKKEKLLLGSNAH